MNEQEIIRRICDGGIDKPIRALYKEFPKINALIMSAGGTKAEAREIFHDALILLIEKVSDPSFKLTSSITTYLYGINRLLWKNKIRKKQSNRELEWSDTLILTNEDVGIYEEKEQKLKALESVLTDISARCREIFSRFYFNKESMQDIASAMGFSSVNSAKTQKYKCMEQAIQLGSNQNLQKS